MAISFPRDLPAGIRFAPGTTFDLMPVEATNRAGGSVQSMELAEPYWSAKFVTVPLVASQRSALQAWIATLRNGRTFLGYDPFRVYPLAYGAAVLGLARAGGGAFDGTAKITDFEGTDASLETLPAGYRASDGDLIELPRAGGQRALHRVIDPATADENGDAIVTLDPPLYSDTILNATTVRLVRARAVMALVPQSFSAPGGSASAASFEAVQTLV